MKYTAVLFLAGCASAFASDDMSRVEAPVKIEVHGYGFNWSRPESAACAVVDVARAASFKHCEVGSEGFGVHKPSSTCRADDGEWIIYPTKPQCEAELETMNANAP